jgi:beta-mannosidase
MKANDFRALRELGQAEVSAKTMADRKGDVWILRTELHNNSTSTPALMVRLKPVRERSGDRILPALFSDNYVTLMPGETRTIETEVQHADTRGEAPAIAVEGFNVKATR